MLKYITDNGHTYIFKFSFNYTKSGKHILNINYFTNTELRLTIFFICN